MSSLEPQNPYRSYLVSASAGSGKTFQLSGRFLTLVGAGADPSKILTLTFTKKAAGEMLERILADARALSTPQKAGAFENHLKAFRDNWAPGRPLRRASEVSKLITGMSQQLNITTIDSVFLDWVGKFPWEGFCNAPPDQTPFELDICSARERENFQEMAWEQLWSEQPGLAALFETGAITPKDWISRTEALQSYMLLTKRHGEEAFVALPCPGGQDEPSLWQAIGGALEEIIRVAGGKFRDQRLQALEERDLSRMAGLITKEATVSGSAIRGKKREQLAEAIRLVDDVLAEDRFHTMITTLNLIGQTMIGAHNRLTAICRSLSLAAGKVTFDDVSFACHNLFHHPECEGVRLMIQQGIEHLLLDEFQDTNQVQWQIFSPIARELLAGAGLAEERSGLAGTVFVVGDEKQSVYGYREADPQILRQVAREFEPFGLQTIHLDHSFRSAQVVLDGVNAVCADRMDDYHPHRTGMIDGQPATPDVGGFRLLPWVECERPAEAPELEAEALAKSLRDFLEAKPQVYCKSQGSMRAAGPQDIAILYRNKTHAALFCEALTKQGLSWHREEGQGFFSCREIQDLVAWIRWLAIPSDTLSQLTVMKSLFINRPDADLMEWLHQGDDGLQHTLSPHERLHKSHVSRLTRETLLAEKLWPHIKAELGAERCAQVRANCERFVMLLQSLENQGHYEPGVLYQKLQDLAQENTIGPAPLDRCAITLMTVHKSKGLEFPVVYLVGTGSPWERRDPYWLKTEDGLSYIGTSRDHPRGYPPLDRMLESLDEALEQENLRLLYVALTRAKQYLFVSGAGVKPNGYYKAIADRLEACPDYDSDHLGLVRHHVCEVDKVIAPQLEVTEGGSRNEAPKKWPSQLKSLAPSRLLGRDEGGREEEPMEPDPLARYRSPMGSWIHLAIERDIKGAPPPSEDQWHGWLHQSQLPLEPAALQAAKEQADQFLASQVWRRFKSEARQILSEVPFQLISDSKLFKGVIDCIAILEEGTLVVDFKTTATLPSDLLKHAIQQGYDKQLQVYCEAVAQTRPNVTGYVFFTAPQKLIRIV